MNKWEKACKEWLKGCSCSSANKQEECKDCTKAFHDHLRELTKVYIEPDHYKFLRASTLGTRSRYGWICPKCGKSNAPWMPTCNCGKDIKCNYSNIPWQLMSSISE